MPLSVNVEKKREGVYIVAPMGRIDSDTYEQLKKTIEPIMIESTEILVLNMDKVYYISSAGLNVILFARKFLEQNNGTFVISNLQPQVKKVFDILKTLPSQAVFKDMQEVDEYLDAIQTKDI